MEIRPVPLDQVVEGRFGRQYVVTGEAGRIAKRLQEIDPSLRVKFNELREGGYFIVTQVVPEGPRKGEEHIVMRVPMMDWDERVIREWEMRAWELRNGISPIKRIEEAEARAKAAADHELEEMIGERAYPLFRAFQRGLGINPRSYRPRSRSVN